MKLNVLLAKIEHSAKTFGALISDYVKFFTNKQGEFLRIRKTYEPYPGTTDEPSMRGLIKVVTTVKEKIDWLESTSSDHIDNVFSLEATNARGGAEAALIVKGTNFGVFSSLELMRLKSLLESQELNNMYINLPVRSDAEIWDAAKDEMYSGREVYEGQLLEGVKKTTEKESYILPDPNITHWKEGMPYTPIRAEKSTVVELGKFTVQRFSGEISHRERAEILKRKSDLLEATIEALKKANECETVKSEMTAKKIFGYIHRGKIE